MSNYAHRLRLAPETHTLMQQMAHEGYYGPKQFTKFLNDLALKDMYADPSKLSKRVTESYGRIYNIYISTPAQDALNDVALSSGLACGDPALIYNNIYTGYIVPIEWPNAFSLMLEHNVPIPEDIVKAHEAQHSQSRSTIEVEDFKPHRVTVGFTLTIKAAEYFGKTPSLVDDLVYVAFQDTRPPLVLEQHNQLVQLHLTPHWNFESLPKVLIQIRVNQDTIDHLASVAQSFGIHAARRDTPNALAAAVLNSLAEGWLSIVTN